jgi:hypothetical protein
VWEGQARFGKRVVASQVASAKEAKEAKKAPLGRYLFHFSLPEQKVAWCHYLLSSYRALLQSEKYPLSDVSSYSDIQRKAHRSRSQ